LLQELREAFSNPSRPIFGAAIEGPCDLRAPGLLWILRSSSLHLPIDQDGERLARYFPGTKEFERGGHSIPLASGHWGKYARSQYAPLPGFNLFGTFRVSCVIVKHFPYPSALLLKQKRP
jgi:hypothetical protein